MAKTPEFMLEHYGNIIKGLPDCTPVVGQAWLPQVYGRAARSSTINAWTPQQRAAYRERTAAINDRCYAVWSREAQLRHSDTWNQGFGLAILAGLKASMNPPWHDARD